MEQKLQQAFKSIKYQQKSDFSENIWQAIVLCDKRNARIKLWVFSTTGLFSLIELAPALKMLFNDFAQSGFYDYFSLLFSSNGSLITFWKDFLLLLAESLPVVSIVLSLTLIFVFFLSLKYAMKQIIKYTRLSDGNNRLSLSF
jgi:hypothetical protein